MIIAWRQRALANVWRLARLIAGTKKGPRRRWGSLVATARPTSEQWKTKLKQKGKEGGWEANFLSEEQIVEPDIEPIMIDMNAQQEAQKDFKQLKWLFRNSRCSEKTKGG